MPEPGGVGTGPGSGGFSGNEGKDRDIADRFRSTFRGGFLTDDPFGRGGAFNRGGDTSRFGPQFNRRRAIAMPLGFGLSSLLQHMFTRNPDGSLGFTPPGGSAAAAEARGRERGDRGIGQGRVQFGDVFDRLFGGGGGSFGLNPVRPPVEVERQGSINELMAALQQSLSPPGQ